MVAGEGTGRPVVREVGLQGQWAGVEAFGVGFSRSRHERRR